MSQPILLQVLNGYSEPLMELKMSLLPQGEIFHTILKVIAPMDQFPKAS